VDRIARYFEDVVAHKRQGIADQFADLFSLGGEIGSRLAYTQESEGQNLLERPFASWRNQQRAGL
jgi:hypothetical protein